MNIIAIILFIVLIGFFIKQVIDLVKAIKERISRKKLQEHAVDEDPVIEIEDND